MGAAARTPAADVQRNPDVIKAYLGEEFELPKEDPANAETGESV